MKLPLTIGAKVTSAIYDADGVPVCLIDSMQEASRSEEVEMARRIVACVNACEGIPTEVLEVQTVLEKLREKDAEAARELNGHNLSLQRANDRWYAAGDDAKRAATQRDELLAALERLLPWAECMEYAPPGMEFSGDHPIAVARAAIARAKGGAA